MIHIHNIDNIIQLHVHVYVQTEDKKEKRSTSIMKYKKKPGVISGVLDGKHVLLHMEKLTTKVYNSKTSFLSKVTKKLSKQSWFH